MSLIILPVILHFITFLHKLNYILIYVWELSKVENQIIEEDLDVCNNEETNALTNNSIDKLLHNIDQVSHYVRNEKFLSKR